ncbi:MAG: hypothetical protein R6W83_03955 [Cryobacterium sp.]
MRSDDTGRGAVTPAGSAVARTDPDAPSGKKELRAEADAARAQLASTLDAIEYKINLPKQLRIKRKRLIRALHQLGEDNALGLLGVAMTTATVVGTVVWFGANAVVTARRR